MSYVQDENQTWWTQTSIQSGDTINTTTSETLFASKPQVFSANSIVAGDVIRFKARGLYGAGGVVAAAYTFRVKLGSVVICSSASIATALGLTGKAWEIEGEASFYSVGASASVECGGKAMLSLGSSINTFDLMPTGGAMVDSTADLQLQISVQPSISLSANTVTMRQFIVEKLKT